MELKNNASISESKSRDFLVNLLTDYAADHSSTTTLVSAAEGLRFKSRAGQIRHSVDNGSPPLRHFFERSCFARTPNDVEMGPINSLHALA